jgi:hypothetical protein
MNKFIFKILVIVLTFIITQSLADKKTNEKDIFSGGMAGHFGYSSIKNNYGEYNGPAFGLGGLVNFYIHKNFRIGSGGASNWMNYETNGPTGSYMKLGYGGVTAELSFPIKKWRISSGLLTGGGSYKNLHIISINTQNQQIVDYIEEGTFIISPLISVERELGESIKLFCMGDFLIGSGISQNGNFGGPMFLIGILFRK